MSVDEEKIINFAIKIRNSMNRIIVSVLLLAFILAGCDNNKSYKKLEEIDHLLTIEKLETAYKGINEIKASDLMDERDSAYFYLLKTQTLYRLYKPVTSDSMINYSIKYYEKTDDKVKLASAYYYKGVVDYSSGRTKDAVVYLKKSETLALMTRNIVLIHKLYESLTDVNANEGEYDLTLKYAKLTLDYSYRGNNNNWKAYALNNMAGIYGIMKMEDSSVIYSKRCIPLLKYIPKKDWVHILTTIGTSCIKMNQVIAKRYLLKALSMQANPYVYSALATIYSKEGKNQEADAYWEEALKTKDLNLKKDVLQAMFEKKYEEKNFKEACNISQQILANNKTMTEKKENDKVKETQMNYDSEMKIVHERQYIVYTCIVALIFLSLILLVLLYSKYKSAKNKNTIMQNQMLINSYSAEIERLRTSNDNRHDKEEALKKKLDNLEKRQSSILYKGHLLFKEIMDGGNISKWHKDDFVNFIEFYKMQDMPFVTHLEEDYNMLTPKNMFYEIMHHLGKTDEELSEIMGVAPSTIRVVRTRIKEKSKLG
jgi:tetratricopeptide (TPR) repeat protein